MIHPSRCPEEYMRVLAENFKDRLESVIVIMSEKDGTVKVGWTRETPGNVLYALECANRELKELIFESDEREV
jgi:hypothetical protein